jgi:hypothetical protein
MKSARIKSHGCDLTSRVESAVGLIRRDASLQQRLFSVMPFSMNKRKKILTFLSIRRKQETIKNSGIVIDCNSKGIRG